MRSEGVPILRLNIVQHFPTVLLHSLPGAEPVSFLRGSV